MEHVTDDQVGDGIRQNRYDAARRVFPDFSGRFSPKKFTQPQILTILALRQFFKLDYRGTIQRLSAPPPAIAAGVSLFVSASLTASAFVVSAIIAPVFRVAYQQLPSKQAA